MSAESQHDLIFQAKMNIYYHEGLESWFGNIINWSAFLSIVLSSVAFSDFANLLSFVDKLAPVFTFLVAALNGAVLAFGMNFKYQQHSTLKRQWYDFLSQAQTTEEDDPHWETLTLRFHAINAEEPASNRKRLLKAHEETELQMGLRSEVSE